jgi:predicted dehydrogenase
MKTYHVGFVGFGFIGKVHAYGYLNLPLFYSPVPLPCKITHICTGRPETAAEGCAAVGATHAVTDYRHVTENPDIDIVHICSPNHRHAEALLSAMAHQKQIYCDKPLTATLAEAEAVERALPSYKGTAQMTLQNRFFPAVLRARQLIDSGFLGDILEFRASYLHAGSADPKAPLKWKLSAEAGGGVIADLASHVLDLVHHLLGDYASILADTRIAYPTRPAADDPARQVPVTAEDCVMMLARLRNGALGTLEASKIATGSEDEVRFEIHGSRGALRYNGMDPHHLEVYDATVADKPIGGMRGWTRVDTGQRYPEPAAAFPGPKFAIGWMRGHMACLANFLCDVAAGRPGDPGLSQGIRIQRLMESARQSAAERKWVDIHG